MQLQLQSQALKEGLDPPAQLVTKNYSLLPDMVGGWRPKARMVGPIPLNFSSRVLDALLEQLSQQSKSIRLVYLGPRPKDSFKLHEQMSNFYSFKYAYLTKNSFKDLSSFFKKFYSSFVNPASDRHFIGTNPFLQQTSFQSGNLDAVIKVSEHQFDLFMRVDSNTRGHLQWYNFKNSIEYMQLQQAKMPLLKSLQLTRECDRSFTHLAENIGCRPALTSNFKKNHSATPISSAISSAKGHYLTSQYTYYQLSFTLQLVQNEQVQCCYSIPYTYSRMLAFKDQVLATYGKSHIIRQEKPFSSLTSLDIPLITITDFLTLNKKRCLLAIARQHPGQSNASFVMQAFIRFLLSDSPKAKLIRQVYIIKIIPMINPDGVVLGNFRTSAGGRDLNRLFQTGNLHLFPQVQSLKMYARRLKNQFKLGMDIFLDFHGHSLRKNAFVFGPQYGPWDDFYMKSKIIPKLVSQKTQIFRYYSCSFRLTKQKKSTARALMIGFSPVTLTVQCSNHSYYDSIKKTNVQMNQSSFRDLGKFFGQAVCEYAQMQENARRERKKQKKHKNKKEKGKEKESMKQSQKLNPDTQQQQIYKAIQDYQKARQQEDHSSDQYSNMTSDSQTENLDQVQISKLQEQVRQGRLDVEQSLMDKSNRKASIDKVSSIEKKPIQLMSCLRKDRVKSTPIKQNKNKPEQSKKLFLNNITLNVAQSCIDKQQLERRIQVNLLQHSDIFEHRERERRGWMATLRKKGKLPPLM